jgi:hypothetical protein
MEKKRIIRRTKKSGAPPKMLWNKELRKETNDIYDMQYFKAH